ncbi:MAG: hypothetical protein CMM87_06670 [Rickettsiales bacterium]|nr:hypothetical protein [Rickettsiales bacterium]
MQVENIGAADQVAIGSGEVPVDRGQITSEFGDFTACLWCPATDGTYGAAERGAVANAVADREFGFSHD